VDSFDGVFQKLSLTGGRHHIEVKADGYQTAEFDVLITSGQTVTYQGELKKIQ
jgi:PEGA domain